MENKDNRNRKLLLYGLNTNYNFKNNEVAEEDNEKREILIKIKKNEFNSNPNLHVSKTRLTFRNLAKQINSDQIKEVIKETIDNIMKGLDDDQRSYYNKVKKIKQIKLILNKNEMDKEGKSKSKCIAFVEVCDMEIGKQIIDWLNNYKLGKKFLIIDFALEDKRKLMKREKSILLRKKMINEKRKEKSILNKKKKKG